MSDFWEEEEDEIPIVTHYPALFQTLREDFRKADRWIVEQDEARDVFLREGDRPKDFNPHRLVRVDVAIMALHLLAARLVFKSFAGIYQDIVEQAERKVAQSTIEAARSVAWSVGKTVVNWFLQAALFGTRLFHSVQLEGMIRLAGLTVKNDLIDMAMRDRTDKVALKKEVLTRHGTHRQRKRNKSWRQQ